MLLSKKCLLLGLCLISSVSLSAFVPVELGKTLPSIHLDGDLGSKVSGGPWEGAKEALVLGKVFSLFYVDPDEKDTNLDFEKALDKEKFPKEKFKSMAIINMDATILPNFAIESSLKSKQKDFPDVMYVKDFKKALVKQWGLADDAYVYLLIDKQGKVLVHKTGKISPEETLAIIDLIKKNIE